MRRTMRFNDEFDSRERSTKKGRIGRPCERKDGRKEGLFKGTVGGYQASQSGRKDAILG